MKTSFYFVLWIFIYPILDLFHSNVISDNSFLIAIIVVLGLSWIINRTMPHTILYERMTEAAPILEDVYTCNVKAFSKRLSRDTILTLVNTLYFLASTLFIGYIVLKIGVSDWIALIVFGFFLLTSLSRSIRLIGFRQTLRQDPTPGTCMEIAEQAYGVNYESYYEERNSHTYEEMFGPRPKYFTAFRIFSIIMAVVAATMGLLLIAMGALVMLRANNFETNTAAAMYFLYGSLAAYFGITDLVSVAKSFRKKRAPQALPQPFEA